ncbi:MAG: hypothetical protein V9F00_14820 [Nocardioides sp.]
MFEKRVDLDCLRQAIASRQGEWDDLLLVWRVSPIKDNYGQPVITADCENESHLASIVAWVSGELDLDVARKADGLVVAKHFDLLGNEEFDGVLEEVLSFVRVGTHPPDGVASTLGRN